ncbi:hypothetical protein QJQ45_007433 [Haematococcus lacustris]|nr:hypothetical protein QJQ45_007433 [Haematococcus lacustris]
MLAAATYTLGPLAIFNLYVIPYWINVVWLDVVTAAAAAAATCRRGPVPADVAQQARITRAPRFGPVDRLPWPYCTLVYCAVLFGQERTITEMTRSHRLRVPKGGICLAVELNPHNATLQQLLASHQVEQSRMGASIRLPLLTCLRSELRQCSSPDGRVQSSPSSAPAEWTAAPKSSKDLAHHFAPAASAPMPSAPAATGAWGAAAAAGAGVPAAGPVVTTPPVGERPAAHPSRRPPGCQRSAPCPPGPKRRCLEFEPLCPRLPHCGPEPPCAASSPSSAAAAAAADQAEGCHAVLVYDAHGLPSDTTALLPALQPPHEPQCGLGVGDGGEHRQEGREGWPAASLTLGPVPQAVAGEGRARQAKGGNGGEVHMPGSSGRGGPPTAGPQEEQQLQQQQEVWHGKGLPLPGLHVDEQLPKGPGWKVPVRPWPALALATLATGDASPRNKQAHVPSLLLLPPPPQLPQQQQQQPQQLPAQTMLASKALGQVHSSGSSECVCNASGDAEGDAAAAYFDWDLWLDWVDWADLMPAAGQPPSLLWKEAAASAAGPAEAGMGAVAVARGAVVVAAAGEQGQQQGGQGSLLPTIPELLRLKTSLVCAIEAGKDALVSSLLALLAQLLLDPSLLAATQLGHTVRPLRRHNSPCIAKQARWGA